MVCHGHFLSKEGGFVWVAERPFGVADENWLERGLIAVPWVINCQCPGASVRVARSAAYRRDEPGLGQILAKFSVAITSASKDRARRPTRLGRHVKQNGSIGHLCTNHLSLGQHNFAGVVHDEKVQPQMSHLRRLWKANASIVPQADNALENRAGPHIARPNRRHD